jgi:uncharacterized pyridoxamine 5'-phosphate oxidase family protein
MATAKRTSKKPAAGRPNLPNYGISENRKDLLPWKWAEERLKNTSNYFLSTVRPDGRPHVMPIWGIWLGMAFYFSTAKTSIKARNLAANPNCVLCPGDADEAVILEGIAKEINDKKTLSKFAKLYYEKYKWDLSEMTQPVYILKPKVVFGHIEKTYAQTATRWQF